MQMKWGKDASFIRISHNYVWMIYQAYCIIVNVFPFNSCVLFIPPCKSNDVYFIYFIWIISVFRFSFQISYIFLRLSCHLKMKNSICICLFMEFLKKLQTKWDIVPNSFLSLLNFLNGLIHQSVWTNSYIKVGVITSW